MAAILKTSLEDFGNKMVGTVISTETKQTRVCLGDYVGAYIKEEWIPSIGRNETTVYREGDTFAGRYKIEDGVVVLA